MALRRASILLVVAAGEPSGRCLWQMSRTANLSDAVKATIMTRTAAIGYDLALVRETRHLP